MSISAFLAVMAFWSHKVACRPTDPGKLEWHHFRTDAQLKEVAHSTRTGDDSDDRLKDPEDPTEAVN